jgi:hypothetical protein
VWRAAEQVQAEYDPTMRPSGPALLAMAVLICFPIAIGEELKPDREVSVTSIEHRASKTYRISAKAWVEGKTPASPPSLYYELTCGAMGGYSISTRRLKHTRKAAMEKTITAQRRFW